MHLNLKFLKKISFITLLAITLSFTTYITASAEKSSETVESFYKKPTETTENDKSEQTEQLEDDDVLSEESTSTSTSFGFLDFLRMIVATVFVIVLLYGTLRFINKKNKLQDKGNLVTNLGGTTIGSNRSVQIIKIGNSLYVVGVGENVQLLTQITNEEEKKQILNEHNQAVERVLAPADLLSKLYKNKRIQKKDQLPFVEQFKQQLATMSKDRKQLQKELQKKEKFDDE